MLALIPDFVPSALNYLSTSMDISFWPDGQWEKTAIKT